MDDTATKQDIEQLSGMVTRRFDQLAKRFDNFVNAEKLDRSSDRIDATLRILRDVELRLWYPTHRVEFTALKKRVEHLEDRMKSMK